MVGTGALLRGAILRSQNYGSVWALIASPTIGWNEAISLKSREIPSLLSYFRLGHTQFANELL